MSAPRCSRGHRPVFCQRRSDTWLNGRRHIRHDCPVCGFIWFTRRPNPTQQWRHN